ncbi:right-handed parallel beta-helix repeat-containing protein [Janibacter cremeus]|uniref:right-handed parallel beta-helix repeat-containing protein n=1 Tax=Janibacter cremeus TaxID=1285192 RepID=UPI0023F94014|nr:right-handed parallel beta-helix repeat-containing protein [Janibacter cremeus]WEV76940.1 right-handed parallel beta-helix repeat-containing protein [Janibacter cremeus]
MTRTDTLTITKDGTVVDGRRVDGRILIEADDVTIRNTLVRTRTSLYPIHVANDTTGALIEDVEVDNRGGTGIGVYFQGSGTLRGADVHSASDGIRIEADDVTIADSFIHDLRRQPDGHHDTIQLRSGDDVTITGNTLQPYEEATDDPMNAAIQIGSLSGDDRITNLVVSKNLMNGGNHTINGGGRGEVESARYSGNEFGRDCRYGPAGNIENSVWEDTNVWHDTGEPVR